MKKLSAKEEEIMGFLWENGPMFVRDICELYPDPKPHYNTVSTFIRLLEEKNMVDHKAFGGSHQYFPAVSKEEYCLNNVNGFVTKFFGDSPRLLVSALIEQESLSLDELKDLIREVEKNQSK